MSQDNDDSFMYGVALYCLLSHMFWQLREAQGMGLVPESGCAWMPQAESRESVAGWPCNRHGDASTQSESNQEVKDVVVQNVMKRVPLLCASIQRI